MRIAVVAGLISHRPWGDGRLAADAAVALARRGHDVHVIADAIDDPSLVPGVASVISLRPAQDNPHRIASRFARFVQRELQRTPHDASISFSRLVPAPVWFPIDFSARAWLTATARNTNPFKLWMKALRHVALPAALRLERSAGNDPRIRALLVSGPAAAADAARAFPGLASRITDAGIASRLDPLPPEQLRALRAGSRELLDIAPDRRVVLVGAPWNLAKDDADLRAFLDGLALMQDRAPAAVFLARDAVSAHTAAVRAGVERHVRIISRTLHLDAALAAADAAAVPFAPIAGPFWTGSLGRFAADAIRLGRPVLAAPHAPGAHLVAAVPAHHAGIVLDGVSANAWAAALAHLHSDDWLERASDAARQRSPSLAFDRVVDRIETTLHAGVPIPAAATP